MDKIDEFLDGPDDYQAQAEHILPALIQQESGGNPNAVSNKGAFGLGQTMPATARDPGFGVQPMLDNSVGEQRRMSRDYLAAMLKKYRGDERLALAAYNAGPGAVDKFGGVPPYKETQSYVSKIISALNPIGTAQAESIPSQSDHIDAFLDAPDEPQAAQSAQPAAVSSSPQDQPSYDPTEGMSGSDLRMAGLGKSIVDTGRGLGQLAREYAPGLANMLGVPDAATLQQQIDESKRLDKPLMSTASGLVGNIGGNVGLSMLPGGAVKLAGGLAKAPAVINAGRAMMNPATVKGAATLGAALAGSQPVASDESRLANAAIGAAGGGAGAAIPGLLSRAVSPNIAPEMRQLLDEGVKPTMGQLIGGGAQKLESKLTSVPIVGDMISVAGKRANESFNKAALNRALKPIGASLPDDVPMGYEAVDYAANKLGDSYEELLPKLRIHMDDKFKADIDGLKDLADELPEAGANFLHKLINTQLLNRFTPEGNMLGENMKQVDSKLGLLIRRYGRDHDADKQTIAEGLREAQSILRNMVERNNPEFSGQLKKINEGYANLVRIERAAASTGANEGIFTPAQLNSATKAADSSVRKRATAHGQALMQDLATAGEKTMTPYPDSGTAGRLAAMASGGGIAWLLNPKIFAALVGGAGMYTQPAQNAMRGLLSRRWAGAPEQAKLIESLGPALGRIGAGYGSSDLNQ